MKKIAIYPRSDGVNRYLERNSDILHASVEACVSEAPTIRDIILSPFKYIRFNKYDVVVVNWLDNHIKSRNHGISLVGVFWFFFYLAFYKFSSRKLIYVRHNNHPHQMVGWAAKLGKCLTSFGANLCDEKVAHSGHLVNCGYAYIPHPLYEVKPPRSICPNLGFEDPYYVIFGNIVRYKNIESVINVWDSEIKLVIAGVPVGQNYVDELVGLASSKNIEVLPRYLSEAEAQELVSGSRGLILSHMAKEMIVSGSFFYAITLGTPVLTLDQPFFNWIKREYGFEGLCIYSSMSELVGSVGCEATLVFSKESIIRHADELFGDKAAIKAWRELISS